MSDASDPKRMLDDPAFGGGGSSDLARLLRAGKSEVPTDAQVMALAAKIGVIGGLGGAGAAGLGGAAGGGGAAKAAVVGTTAAKAGLAVKIGSAVLVATAATASVAVVATKHHTDVAPQPSVGLVAPSVVVTAPVKSNNGGATAAQAPAILPLEEDPAPSPSASPSSSAHKVAHAPASAEGPEAEVRLLERAQDALRSRPAEALALADDHARRFPSGMLAQEREVIAIEALVKLGRTADAKARATRFKSRFPGSSHTRRIDTLVGE